MLGVLWQYKLSWRRAEVGGGGGKGRLSVCDVCDGWALQETESVPSFGLQVICGFSLGASFKKSQIFQFAWICEAAQASVDKIVMVVRKWAAKWNCQTVAPNPQVPSLIIMHV